MMTGMSRGASVGSDGDVVAEALEQPGQRPPRVRLIVHHQQPSLAQVRRHGGGVRVCAGRTAER
jgi:hypothetical protein